MAALADDQAFQPVAVIRLRVIVAVMGPGFPCGVRRPRSRTGPPARGNDSSRPSASSWLQANLDFRCRNCAPDRFPISSRSRRGALQFWFLPEWRPFPTSVVAAGFARRWAESLALKAGRYDLFRIGRGQSHFSRKPGSRLPRPPRRSPELGQGILAQPVSPVKYPATISSGAKRPGNTIASPDPLLSPHEEVTGGCNLQIPGMTPIF